MHLPDLNSSKHIDKFICDFYQRIFNDDILASIFNKNIKRESHLALVSLYWQKILLGDNRYQNNTINIHRELNLANRFEELHYQRWFKHFEETARLSYSGVYNEKAIKIARNIISNMKKQFLSS